MLRPRALIKGTSTAVLYEYSILACALRMWLRRRLALPVGARRFLVSARRPVVELDH
jgi:hypothetical protein